MKRTRNLMAATVLSLGMALSLTACGSSDSGNTDTKSSSKVDSKKDADSSSAKETKTEKKEEAQEAETKESSGSRPSAKALGKVMAAHIDMYGDPEQDEKIGLCLATILVDSDLSDKSLQLILNVKSSQELSTVDTKMSKKDQEILNSDKLTANIEGQCASVLSAVPNTTPPKTK